jgi:hypothetical protein
MHRLAARCLPIPFTEERLELLEPLGRLHRVLLGDGWRREPCQSERERNDAE